MINEVRSDETIKPYGDANQICDQCGQPNIVCEVNGFLAVKCGNSTTVSKAAALIGFAYFTELADIDFFVDLATTS